MTEVTWENVSQFLWIFHKPFSDFSNIDSLYHVPHYYSSPSMLSTYVLPQIMLVSKENCDWI